MVADGTVRDALDAHGPQEMKQAPPMNNDLFDQGATAVGSYCLTRIHRMPIRIWSDWRVVVTAKIRCDLDRRHANEQQAMKFHAGMAQVNGTSAVRPRRSGLDVYP